MTSADHYHAKRDTVIEWRLILLWRWLSSNRGDVTRNPIQAARTGVIDVDTRMLLVMPNSPNSNLCQAPGSNESTFSTAPKSKREGNPTLVPDTKRL